MFHRTLVDNWICMLTSSLFLNCMIFWHTHIIVDKCTTWDKFDDNIMNTYVSLGGIILFMHPTNGRRRYIVTLSLINWGHTQNDPWFSLLIKPLKPLSVPYISKYDEGTLQVALQWRHNERDGISDHQPHDCSLNCQQVQIKENIKALHHWPLCREFTGDQWIPSTKGQ